MVRTRLKINSFDSREYAKALRVVIANESLWKDMSLEARRYAQQFNYINIVKKYVDLLTSLMT